MTILIDLNQVMISGLIAQVKSNNIKQLEEDLVRHMVLNSLRSHIKKFKNEYGQIVLCCDNKNYWRRDYFKHYKACRKTARDKSDLDWNVIFTVLNELKDDLKVSFPYKVIDVDGAEADDIIGTLTRRLSAHEKVLIISSDGDFKQLHKYQNVKQYNPTLGVYVKCLNPTLELKEKIIRGDKGDGIPNILSADTTFITSTRQKSIKESFLQETLNVDFNDLKNSITSENESLVRNWIRNETLIDLSKIPENIQKNIVSAYDEAVPASKQKLLKYFIDKQLVNLIDVIDEF